MSWQVIPDARCMLKGERPQCLIERFGPVFQLVHHEAAGPRCNGLTSSFGNTVLMMRANSAAFYLLVLKVKIRMEFGKGKGMVVNSVSLHRCATWVGKLFKLVLGGQGLTSRGN